jgi:hypothetical protein
MTRDVELILGLVLLIANVTLGALQFVWWRESLLVNLKTCYQERGALYAVIWTSLAIVSQFVWSTVTELVVLSFLRVL